MNKDEWFKQPSNRSTYEYKYVHRLLNEWKQQNGIAERCVVHHRDDNDEVKSYNEAHYERWGLNPDGTFEYGKYVLFLLASDHVQYHNKGEKHPMYGQHHSEETKEKMSNALKGENNPFFGKRHTDEAKEKMSNALKGEKNPMYDKHLSDETKAKMSNALKGKKVSNETKEKISATMKGKKVSDDTKEKMSQSTKERMQIISDAYKKYKLEGGMITWRDFIKQYYKSIK